MDDLDGVPRNSREPNSITRLMKLVASLRRDIQVLQRAAPQQSMSLTDGGKIDVDGGDITVTNEGQVNVEGKGRDWQTGDPIEIVSSLSNRWARNTWVGFDYLQPGLYFSTGDSKGAKDPRIVSERGREITSFSATELLRNGPQVGTNIVAYSNSRVSPDSASIGSGAWDDALNPGGGNGLLGRKGNSYGYFTPSQMIVEINNEDYEDVSLPGGVAAGISGTLSEGILHLNARNGVDAQGPFTVDGLPVGGAVDSVNTKTGVVVLVKGDLGLGNVDNTSDVNKPISTATSIALAGKTNTGHTHTIANVTGLQAALDAKAAKLRYRRVAGTSLPESLGTSYVSFAAAVTVPADIFGVGVPYLISVFAQLQANPTSGNLVSIQILVNGSVPAGGQVNGVSGPNFANVTASADIPVTTSTATVIDPQATSPFGSTTIGTSGAAAPFYTIKISPYTAF
ncbi:hypothetical protein [Arthrobacter cryoconiti]|uniref:Uncharacterized protein n=1 Tax=Arthrobacter cryoconiti TaxID=748907 RepID=A0ABV8QYY2_9MICC|nr:hypothetical protein [Arthrobacter cryoconiti]MCC9068790.1 hypothetical protein [Arthrobacter cryoconiti]